MKKAAGIRQRARRAAVGLLLEEYSDKCACRKGLFVLSIGKDDMIAMPCYQKFKPANYNPFPPEP